MTRPTYPVAPKDRFEVYRFFNGLSAEGQEGLSQAYTRVPLVKSYLLEHVSARTGHIPKKPFDILMRLGLELRQIDDTLLEVRPYEKREGDPAPKPHTAGYLEQFDERFFCFYTADHAEEARQRVYRWVSASSDLDLTWFSGQFLQSLWDQDVSRRGDHRFSRLVFRHESIFDMPEDVTEPMAAAEVEDGNEEVADDDRPERDRRLVRSEIRDRIGPIRLALAKLQGNYPPLNALYALRLPSRATRGSHDLYQMGQITNRAESFEDHRNMVRYLYRTYKAVLENTEHSAWLSSQTSLPHRQNAAYFKGVPLIINFSEELSQATFDRWLALAFQKRNRFRLWGDPIRLGPKKVHVYGADRHLWQPINLEMSTKRVVAILPKGTCGNTFHRLVTNVQQYVCPKIEVWLGAKPFGQLVSEAQAKWEKAE
jgi:hypothetical protein